VDLSNWIHSQANLIPDKAAFIFNESSISYASFARSIDGYVQILGTELCVKPGDRIAFLGFNSPDMIALLFACARIGAILLPLNWRLAGPEHQQLLAHSKPIALFVDEHFIEHINNISKQLPEIKLIQLGKKIAANSDNWQSMEQLLAKTHGATPFEIPETISEDEGLLLCYTSGTTGVPKGALLSKKALMWNAKNSIDMHQLTAEDIVLTLLPMFHVGGLNIQTLPALSIGASIILLDKFEIERFYQAFEKHPVTITLVVPTLMYAVMADQKWQSFKPEHLRIIAIGSSVVPESLVSAVCNTGVPLIQVYGSTETAPIAAYTPIEDAARKPASTGKTALHCEIRLVDENNNQVPEGDKGEILVRGPNVLLGYWKDQQATSQSFTQGWFHTGDVGHFDEEGFLFVDGRIKDMIICGGENIYPAAIENVLSQCKEVEEVAVAGKPDDYWGEICVAVIVLKTGYSVDEQYLQQFCNNRIASSSIPKKIIFVDELPRNAMGKVLKKSLSNLVTNN